MKAVRRLGGALMMTTMALHAADPEPFPLMAWDYVGDDTTLEKMADCGINMVAFVPPDMLDACARRGVKAIVFSEEVAGSQWDAPFDADRARRALPDLIAKVNEHPAVFGYHLRDEPSADAFEALGEACELVRRLAPGKWPYINLLPGEGSAYDEYLEHFIRVCRPPIISYDRYVLFEDGSFPPVFWTNLAQVRDMAVRHSLPFYNIVLTSAHWSYRVPTDVDLRMQIYGSLVYGARGICYYKFCSGSLPILNAPDLGNFRLGPLDEFGDKTQTWDELRRINRQVRNLAWALLRLRCDDVYHVGEIPALNHGAAADSLVRDLRAGESFVIGDFTHDDGSRWVMIVNKHRERSTYCLPNFRAPVKAVQYVSPVTGELRPYEDRFYALAPGQGVLLKLEF